MPNPLRDISVLLLLKPFYKTGLSANKITVLNFCTLGLGSVVLFVAGEYTLGLLTAGLMAMVDYVDGTIARMRGGGTKLGKFLDTSLDWLYLMLVLGALGYSSGYIVTSYFSLASYTFANWLEFSQAVQCSLPLILSGKTILVIGIVTGQVGYGLLIVGIVQCIRAIIMYRRIVWGE